MSSKSGRRSNVDGSVISEEDGDSEADSVERQLEDVKDQLAQAKENEVRELVVGRRRTVMWQVHAYTEIVRQLHCLHSCCTKAAYNGRSCRMSHALFPRLLMYPPSTGDSIRTCSRT